MILKSQIILYLYDLLINGKEVFMDEIIAKYNISIRTFRRYISELNAFLYNNYKNKEVIYSFEKRSYSLTDF